MVGLTDFIFHLFPPRETSEMFRHFLLITKTTQSRPNCLFFSFICLIIWQFCCHLFTYHKRLPISAMNYAWYYSQSETDKYLN